MESDAPRSESDPGIHLRTIGSVVAVVAGAILIAAVLTSLGMAVLSPVVASWERPGPRALRSAFQFVGFGLTVAAYLAIRNDWDLIDWRVPTLRDLVWIVGGLVGFLALLATLSMLLRTLGIDTAESQIVTAGRENPRYLLYLIPVTILLVGPTEELIFRGIVQGTLRRTYGPGVAVALASAVFALIHWWSLQPSTGDARLVTLGLIFVFGALLGILYEYTGNLVVPIAVHGLFNAVQFAAQYAAQTGIA